MNLQSYYVFCFCLLVLTYNFLLLWVFSLLLTVALIKNDQTDVILVSPRISLYQTLLLQPLLLLYTQNLYCMSADRCSPRNTTSLKFRWSFKIRTPISACVFFPKPLSHSPTPAGCPIVQLNSDTISPEIVSDSTDWRLSPTKLSSASDDSCKSRLLPVLLTHWL